MKQSKGITLVALVITIIVVLILAGISIQAITNQKIFLQANIAVDELTKASMKEKIEIYVSEATYDYYLNNSEGKTYLEFIAEYLENKEDVLIDIVEQNEDEVILNYTQGNNIVQLSLSSNGTLEIIRSGTTSSGIEDTYAPKIKEKDKTKTSITVTITDASGVLAYAYSLENAKPNADSSIWNQIESPAQTKQITITGLETEKTYYIFAKDTKGNISEGVACTTGEYAKITVVYKESSTATGTLETVNTKENATITLISKPSNLNKEGYDFIGWSENENSEEALDTTYIVPNHNVTLYPVWKKSEVSISLVGAVGETISVYDGDKLITTSTELNASGNSTQNIVVPAKSLKFVGSISGYEKTIEVTSDTTEVKVMPEGALYWYGNVYGMGGYTTSTFFKYNGGSWSNAGTISDRSENGLLKLYGYRSSSTASTGFHLISNNYLQLDKYNNLYVKIDSGYISYEGTVELCIKTDTYINYYSSDNKSPNGAKAFGRSSSDGKTDISGVHCLPITNKDKAKLVITLYTGAGNYGYNKEISVNISKIWLE